MEPELNEALRAARSGVFAWDTVSGAIHWDEFVCELVGISPEDFDGRADAFFAALHAADATRLAAATAEVLERGGTYRNRYRIMHPDGGVRRIEERGEVLLGQDGRPHRVIGLLLDRTEDGPDPGFPTLATETVAPAGARRPGGRRTVQQEAGDSFLLTITRALSRAGTAAEVMAVLTDLARPALHAETVLVHLTPTGDPLEIGASPLHDPQPERLHPLRPAAAAALRDAFELERPVFVEGISAPVTSPGEPALTRSWAVLPLVAAGSRIGGCIVGYPGLRRFDEQRRGLFTALGGIVANALSRALLFDAEHERAAELQQAMLPRRTPPVPGLDVAVRYRPGTTGMQVGGDWYELLALGPDRSGQERVGLVIGDVQGHSARASGVMGQLRIALRAFAGEGHDPAEVLARTGRLLAELDTGLFATCCYLELEPATGRLLAARAGHPLPILCDTDGEPRELDVPGGPPLGVDPAASYPLSEHKLGSGEGLLLYTDGLIEDRAHPYDDSVRRLLATLRGRCPSSPGQADLEALAERLLESRPSGGRAQDDLALLLLRRN